MNLIPRPKTMQLEQGELQTKSFSLRSSLSAPRLIKALNQLPMAESGVALSFCIEEKDGEAYTLTVGENSVVITAEGERGAFYAIQTLRQLLTHEKVPCLYIEDKPDFEYRGFYQDVTRGRIPKLETLKQLVDDMAYYKLNTLQLYSEHVFDFKELKGITEKNGCLTAEELRELDAYCRERYIKLIPSLALFGHLYELLNRPEYRHLRVLKDYKPTNIFWDERAYHHTLDPYNPESLELVKSMLDQCMDIFSSDTVNIGCDETFDLEQFKNANPGRLYTDFVRQIADYLSAHGKKVMMWSDVILEHMDLIDELPPDITLLTWGYGKKMREADAERIAALGRPQILCPGCNTWTRLVEDVDISSVNIPGMAKLAARCGARGVMNTSWGDWGQPCSIELSMYGFLMGAEMSWHVGGSVDSEFDESVNALYYKNECGAETLKTLSALATAVPWWHFGATYSNRICENGNLKAEIPDTAVLKQVQSDCHSLIERVLGEAWGNDECKTEILTVAEGVCFMAEIFSALGGAPLRQTVDCEAWLEKYRAQWLKKNKPSELHNIEAMFRHMSRAAEEARRECRK